MSSQELYDNKKRSLQGLEIKYGLQFSNPGLIDDITYVAESQKKQNAQDLLDVLSKPLVRKLSEAITDNNTRLQLLSDIINLIRNGYNIQTDNNYAPITPGDDPRIIFTKVEKVNKPEIVWGDEPTPSNDEVIINRVINKVDVNLPENIILTGSTELIQSLNELSNIFKILNNDTVESVINSSALILDNYRTMIPDPSEVNEEEIMELVNRVIKLKETVTNFRRENPEHPSDRNLHDTVQSPLAYLESQLQVLLENKVNPIRDVTDLIKLG